jgi:hypothetical protein
MARHVDLLFAGAAGGRVYGSSDDALLRQQTKHFHLLDSGEGDAGSACQGEYHLLGHFIRRSLEGEAEASAGSALMQIGGNDHGRSPDCCADRMQKS